MPFAQLEARLLLATILQRYSPRLVPGCPVVPRPRVTLRPKYGVQMVLEPTRPSAVLSRLARAGAKGGRRAMVYDQDAGQPLP